MRADRTRARATIRSRRRGAGPQNAVQATTRSFTADARQEATRDGAPPVDLIDGDRLCDLLKEYELGIRRTVRQVEEIHVTPEFFADL